jgi:hypothetical protein
MAFCGLDNPEAIRSGGIQPRPKQVIVAHHSGRVLPLGTMKAIIEGSGILPAAWLK